MSHEEIITKQTKLQQKPISKIWIYSPQATNIIQKSAETEQKSIPVEANGKPHWKYLKMLIFSNQSLEKSLLKRLSASKIPPAEPQKAPPLSRYLPLALCSLSKALTLWFVLPQSLSAISLIETPFSTPPSASLQNPLLSCLFLSTCRNSHPKKNLSPTLQPASFSKYL